METAGSAKDDHPPPRPEGVHSGEKEQPTYSKMMAALLDQVNRALDEKKPDDRYSAMVEEIQGHEDKVKALQKELLFKLDELENEDRKKITSADMHTGFDSSHVAKSTAADKKGATQVELLNPSFSTSGGSSGEEASMAAGGDDEEVEASPDAKRFAQIKADDYQTSLQFLLQHPQMLTERETDGLLVLAFDAALERNDDFSRQCVHQALLLQYCRALGKDGVGLFFKRITTKGHQAQGVFYKDVQETYMRIKTRSREILAERAKEPAEGVEQIQLHAVEPGTVINITVPAADSQDAEVQKARAIYDGFKPEMKSALESGELDQVNKVLGRLGVEEAEELIGLFGEVGGGPRLFYFCAGGRAAGGV